MSSNSGKGAVYTFEVYPGSAVTGPCLEETMRIVTLAAGMIIAEEVHSRPQSSVHKLDLSSRNWDDPRRYKSFNPENNLYDPATQKELDTPLEKALTFDGRPVIKRRRYLINQLAERGLYTVRDAIVTGEAYIVRADQGIADGSLDLLKLALKATCPAIPLRDTWKAQDVALFCDSLDQIPVHALRQNAHGDAYSKNLTDGRRETIAELLQRDAGRLATMDAQCGVVTRARTFAIDFEAARFQHLQPDRGQSAA